MLVATEKMFLKIPTNKVDKHFHKNCKTKFSPSKIVMGVGRLQKVVVGVDGCGWIPQKIVVGGG